MAPATRIATLLMFVSCFALAAEAVTYRLTAIDGLQYGNALNASGAVLGLSSTFDRATVYHDGRYTDIGLPDGSTVHPSAINSAGQVVGEAYIPGFHNGFRYFEERGFLASGNQVEVIDPLKGGLSCAAFDINDNGQVLGWSQALWAPDQSYVNETFVYSAGVMRVLPRSSSYGIFPTAINNAGQVVGKCRYNSHSLLFNPDGIIIDLGVGIARDINDRGQVVGDSGPLGGAWLYDNGQRIELGSFNGETTNIYGINNDGQILGDTSTTPFLYQNGAFHDLRTMIDETGSGWRWRVKAINDSGLILANGTAASGQTRAVLLAPSVPEPGMLGMVVLGLFMAAPRGRLCAH